MKYIVLLLSVLMMGVSCKEDEVVNTTFVDMDMLTFDLGTTDVTFSVSNISEKMYKLTLEYDTSLLVLNRWSSPSATDLLCLPGAQMDFTFMVKRENVKQDTVYSEIRITNNQGYYETTLPVIIVGYTSDVTRLGQSVVDPICDADHTTLVYLSTLTDFTLNMVDLESKEQSTIDLDKEPKCVSISPNGHFCAIGYDHRVDIVDVLTRTLLFGIDVNSPVRDIVISDNGWCYLFPLSDSDYSLQSLNVATKEVVVLSNQWLSYRFKAALSVDQTSIYALPIDDEEAGRYTSYSRIFKYDISGGALSLKYETDDVYPNNLGDDLFLLNGGEYMLTGNIVLTSSSAKSLDAKTFKVLGTSYDYSSVAQLGNDGDIFTVINYKNGSAKLLRRDAESFEVSGFLDVSYCFESEGSSKAVVPHYVFGAEEELFVLSTTEDEYWVLQTIKM